MSPLPSHSLVPVGAADIVDAYLVRACAATAPAIERDVLAAGGVGFPGRNGRRAKGFFVARRGERE